MGLSLVVSLAPARRLLGHDRAQTCSAELPRIVTSNGEQPVAAATDEREQFRILDAGCGRAMPDLEVARDNYTVGIDISAEALELNGDLDEKILGDLQSYPLPNRSFDLILCFDVLEHLSDPRTALDNLVQALKPGGRLMLGMPNVLSPKALATKFTPHYLHILYYRRVLRYSDAGRPGFGPFKTYLRWWLRPRSIRRYAAIHGLEVEQLDVYEPESWAWFWEKHPRLLAVLSAAWRRIFDGADPRASEMRAVLVRAGP